MDAICIFCDDNCLEELDYLDIYLNRFESLAICHLLHHLLLHKELSDLKLVDIVRNQPTAPLL